MSGNLAKKDVWLELTLIESAVPRPRVFLELLQDLSLCQQTRVNIGLAQRVPVCPLMEWSGAETEPFQIAVGEDQKCGSVIRQTFAKQPVR